jgi:hypothetical protein
MARSTLTRTRHAHGQLRDRGEQLRDRYRLNLGQFCDRPHREDALAASQEAVTICRQLAAARPDAFLPDLAMSLNNQSGCLSELGRRECGRSRYWVLARIP